MLLRDTYKRRDYKKLIEGLREEEEIMGDYTTAELLKHAAEAIEELEDEVYDWKAYGKWIHHVGGKFIGFPKHYECDQCHNYEPKESKFCPHCGAKMEGE